MSVEFDRESPGKFDSRTLSRETLSRWTGCTNLRVAACQNRGNEFGYLIDAFMRASSK